MSLIYFVPGRSTLPRAAAIEAGLGHVLEQGEGVAFVAANSGPDGAGAGVYACVPNGRGEKGEPRAGERATGWRRVPGGKALVGFVGETRPGDLARPTQVLGHDVQLGDGQRWHVPVARLVTGEPGLPTALSCDDDGAWSTGPVVPRHRQLWEDAERVWSELRGAARGPVELDLSGQAAVAVRALATNYRVGPAEVSALGLLDTAAMAGILRALIDWPTFQRLMEEVELGEEEAAGPS